jgi:methylmalonyl-CoA/ethylmalonyl-CoA epimerase
MNAHSFGSIGQVAYLVEDIDASVEHWARFSGIGPWTIYKNVSLDGWWKGQDTTITINVGLSYQDGVQMELIEVTNTGPSPYRREDGSRIIGMHHMAWLTQNFDADVAKAKERGLTQVFRAGNAASKVTYFVSPAEPGILWEFIEVTPMLQAGFDHGVAASRAWDGKDPILQVIDFSQL